MDQAPTNSPPPPQDAAPPPKVDTKNYPRDEFSLPAILVQKCRDVFKNCNEFSNFEQLRAIFIADELVAYKSKIKKADNAEGQIDLIIDFLVSLKNNNSTSVIIIFIEILHGKYLNDAIGNQLIELKEEIQNYFDQKQRNQNQIRQDHKDAFNNFSKTSNDITDVENWFEKAGDDLKDRALWISIAIFNGASVQSVTQAANDLYEQIKPPEVIQPQTTLETSNTYFTSPQVITQTPSVFSSANRTSTRLKRAGATTKSKLLWDGNIIQIVELTNTSYPIDLLKLLWEDYPALQDPLLKWLSTWSAAPTSDMRVRAATAIGALCTIDFVHVRPILFEWAHKDDRIYRAAISIALGTIAHKPEFQKPLLRLLENWQESGDNSLIWASVRAYTIVGVFFPEEAFACWQKIFETIASDEISIEILLGTNPLINSTQDAILTMLDNAVNDETLFLKVFDKFTQQILIWLKSQNMLLSLTGYLLLSPATMMSLNLAASKDTSKEAIDTVPIMLRLVSNRNEGYLLNLKAFLEYVIMSSELEILGKYLLMSWFEKISDNSKYDSNLILILKKLAPNLFITGNVKDRITDRIERYIKNWATRPQNPITSAKRIQGKLIR